MVVVGRWVVGGSGWVVGWRWVAGGGGGGSLSVVGVQPRREKVVVGGG